MVLIDIRYFLISLNDFTLKKGKTAIVDDLHTFLLPSPSFKTISIRNSYPELSG
ncbi:hypothetical protein [Chryseobacterium sp. KCF3-3]|uniref:hypothetical protein n=1 Tax=Chryseobacterium sp. KCF3-3 TaxID=3231511 RepID=UPI0038B32EA5